MGVTKINKVNILGRKSKQYLTTGDNEILRIW